MADIVCFRCMHRPHEISEYNEAARELLREEFTDEFDKDYIFPQSMIRGRCDEYIQEDEGTYNPETRTFCCTSCYIEIGMPVAPGGWKAPQRGTKWPN